FSLNFEAVLLIQAQTYYTSPFEIEHCRNHTRFPSRLRHLLHSHNFLISKSRSFAAPFRWHILSMACRSGQYLLWLRKEYFPDMLRYLPVLWWNRTLNFL